MRTKFLTHSLSIAIIAAGTVQAKSPSPSSTSSSVPVTVDNFIRAETDRTFAANVKQGAFGKFEHLRELAAIDDQRVQRQNRDTLYSVGIFDLDAGPVTVSLPDAGKRFMTMIVIDEDHYVYTVVYGKGSYSFDKAKVGTRYALAAIRTLVDPNDPKDLEQAHALQDAVKVEQPGGPGKFEVPKWDQASRKKIADALTVLGATLVDCRGAAGGRNEVDPVRHLIVTATGWGLNPDKDAIYLNVMPGKNDGTTIYKLNVKDVPVDGFWSITLYNAEGYLVKNDLDAYSFTTSPLRKTTTARLRFSSAVAMAKRPTVCRSCPAGTTRCGSIAREKKSSMELGSFRKRSRNDIFPRESNS